MALTTAQRSAAYRERKRNREAIHHDNSLHEFQSQQRAEQNANKDLSQLLFLGEVKPTIDSENISDALYSALLFCRALGIEDPVVAGETSLLDLERRIFNECLRVQKVGCLNLLSRKLADREFDPKLTEQTFDSCWVPLEGAELPITPGELHTAKMRVKLFHNEKLLVKQPEAPAEPTAPTLPASSLPTFSSEVIP